jgi:hypothetical protein
MSRKDGLHTGFPERNISGVFPAKWSNSRPVRRFAGERTGGVRRQEMSGWAFSF